MGKRIEWIKDKKEKETVNWNWFKSEWRKNKSAGQSNCTNFRGNTTHFQTLKAYQFIKLAWTGSNISITVRDRAIRIQGAFYDWNSNS